VAGVSIQDHCGQLLSSLVGLPSTLEIMHLLLLRGQDLCLSSDHLLAESDTCKAASWTHLQRHLCVAGNDLLQGQSLCSKFVLQGPLISGAGGNLKVLESSLYVELKPSPLCLSPKRVN